MNLAAIVLDYVKVLVWPAIVVFVLVRYRKPLRRLLQRFVEESDEISSTYLGLSAKFRRQITSISSEIAQAPDSGAAVELTKRLQSLAGDQFRILCTNFFTQPVETRTQTGREVAELSKYLSLDDLLRFWMSPLPGEKVGAAIGIGAHIHSNPVVASDTRVRMMLRAGLVDDYSRVRFRVVQAVAESEALIHDLEPDLREIARTDENEYVRDAARRALRR